MRLIGPPGRRHHGRARAASRRSSCCATEAAARPREPAASSACGYDASSSAVATTGCVCGAYLARGGLRTLVLERRDEVGGALATAEIVPGARVPVLCPHRGRLRGSIARDLGLSADGLRLVQPAARVTSLRADGPPITLWGDPMRTASELDAVSRHDAAAWAAFDAEVRTLVGRPVAPDGHHAAGSRRPRRRATCSRRSASGCTSAGLDETHARALLRVLPQSIADFLEDRFETDALRAMLARARHPLLVAGASLGGHPRSCCLPTPRATTGARRGRPSTPEAAREPWPCAGIDRAARRAPRSGPVREVVAVRSHGWSRHRRHARDRARSSTPRWSSAGWTRSATLLELVDPEVLGPRLGWQAGNLRQSRRHRQGQPGALETCPLRGLDRRRWRHAPPGADPWSRRSMRYLDDRARCRQVRAHSATSRGWRRPSRAWSTRCSSTAPRDAGVRHVMSVLLQSAPTQLRDGDWTAGRERSRQRRPSAVLESVAPGYRRPGRRAPGAHADRPRAGPRASPAVIPSTASQPRPVVRVAADARATPAIGCRSTACICAAPATHPGGGVTGVPGRNAAREVLVDRRRGRG